MEMGLGRFEGIGSAANTHEQNNKNGIRYV